MPLFSVTQKSDWYLKINPNGRIPAIRHHGAGPKGEDIDVFESGAILEYIAEAFPEGGAKLLPKEEPARSATRGWLHWQMGGLGPMMGQAFHFMFKKPKVEYAFERYTDESKRLLGILDKRVGESEWLNGSGFSLAECAIVPWVAGALKPERAEMAEAMFGISAFKNLPKWVERCKAIEAVGKGMGALSAKKEGEGEGK